MTVKELRKALKAMPQDADVFMQPINPALRFLPVTDVALNNTGFVALEHTNYDA